MLTRGNVIGFIFGDGIMRLSDRKILILEAIINDYIETAEPIGSRTIAKKYDLGISSATIRNEMSDLEEMGLIIQPHASAGRVPSDKGYRLYVDKLMKKRELTEEEIEYLYLRIANSVDQIDFLMQEAAKAISVLTNYTTIISQSSVSKMSVKHIQLIPFDDNAIVLVIVTDNKTVKNQIINVSEFIEPEVLTRISNILNLAIKEKRFDSLSNADLEKIKKYTPGYEKLIETIYKTTMEVLSAEENARVFLSGAKNLLEFPEFSDISKAKGILQAFEEKDVLLTILGKYPSDTMSIVIGDENEINELKNCSVIRSNIKIGEGTYGSIGILGPTRMDYSQSVSILKGFAATIEKAIKLLTGG